MVVIFSSCYNFDNVHTCTCAIFRKILGFDTFKQVGHNKSTSNMSIVFGILLQILWDMLLILP